jgi:hypothetical protein
LKAFQLETAVQWRKELIGWNRKNVASWRVWLAKTGVVHTFANTPMAE